MDIPYYRITNLKEAFQSGRPGKNPSAKRWSMGSEEGYSLAELMVVLVIVGILTLLAIPQFSGVMNRAYTVEAREQLRFLVTLQESFYYEHGRYGTSLSEIGFEQRPLVETGGTARYVIRVESADQNGFVAIAESVVDFDKDGSLNVWEANQDGIIKERTAD